MAYGVTIQTAPLLFVALAWPRLRDTLQFFDLVFLRRHSTTLVSTSETIARLPDEVWEEIRSHVVENEVSDSEQNFLAGFVCGECLEGSKAGRRRLDWSSFDEMLKRCPRDARSFDNWIARAFCLFVLPEPFVSLPAVLSTSRVQPRRLIAQPDLDAVESCSSLSLSLRLQTSVAKLDVGGMPSGGRGLRRLCLCCDLAKISTEAPYSRPRLRPFTEAPYSHPQLRHSPIYQSICGDFCGAVSRRTFFTA